MSLRGMRNGSGSCCLEKASQAKDILYGLVRLTGSVFFIPLTGIIDGTDGRGSLSCEDIGKV